MKKIILLIILLLIIIIPGYSFDGIYLNYSDLIELSKTEKPHGELLQKLQNQLNTVTTHQPPEPEQHFLKDKKIGDFFRVGSWNIERGFNVDLIEKILVYPRAWNLSVINIDKDDNDELLTFNDLRGISGSIASRQLTIGA